MGWRWVGLPARAGAAEEEKGDGPEKKREAQGGREGFLFFCFILKLFGILLQKIQNRTKPILL
jgi:hypothetical protein